MSLSFNKDSVVGGPITSGTLTQIEQRQRIIEKRNNRSTDDVLFLTSNTGWVKLTSSINLSVEKEEEFRQRQLRSLEPITRRSDSSAAQANVLTGGTLRNGRLTAGIFNQQDTAYSKSGVQGFRPDAGITSFQVDTKSMFGALRVATVNFKVNSIEQLNTLESLFLRPGFSMLLEWGHSIYVDNNGVIVKNPTTYSDFFTPAEDSQKIIKELKRLRDESSYNYDAMFGIVKNFVWSYNLDGGYDCQVDLVSQGELIESLSVIISPGTVQADSNNLVSNQETDQEGIIGSIEDGDSKKITTPLHVFLNALNFVGTNFESKRIQKRLNNIRNTVEKKSPEVSNKFLKKLYQVLPDNEITVGNIDQQIIPTQLNNIQNLALGSTERLGDTTKLRILYWQHKNSEEESDRPYSNYALIPLQYLLILINELFLLKSKEESKENSDENIVRLFTGALDPGTGERKNITPFVTFDGHFALNPTKVILPKGRKEVTDTRLGYLPENQIPTKGLAKDDILNIFISTDLILSALDSTLESSDTSKQTVLIFLKNVLKEINKQLGEINDLDLGYDEVENIHYVIDRKITPNDNGLPTLNLVGSQSQAENISFSSKLSNNVTSMMAISAQAGNTDVGVDTLAVQKWNTGLVDRHLLNKFVGTETKKDKEKAEDRTIPFVKEEDLFRLLRFVDMVNFLQDDNIYTLNDEIEQADALSVIHRKVMHGLLNYNTKKEKTNPAGLIPFELSLTLRGISGIKVGQAFKIQDSLIPDRYRGNVGFICTGVSHKIESNRWLTDLQTQMCIISSESLLFEEKEIELPSREEVRRTANEPEASATGRTFYSIFNRVQMKTRLNDGKRINGRRGTIGIYNSLRLNSDGTTRFHQAWDVLPGTENGRELPLKDSDIFMPMTGIVEWQTNASSSSTRPVNALVINGTGEYKDIRMVLLYLKDPIPEVLNGEEIKRGTIVAKADSSSDAYSEQNTDPDAENYQKDHIHISMKFKGRKIDPRKEEWFPKPAPEIDQPVLTNLDPFSDLPV